MTKNDLSGEGDSLSLNGEKEIKLSLRRYERCKEGDLVILFGGYETISQVILTSNGKFQTKSGLYLHNDIIGKTYGTRIMNAVGTKWMAVLKPTPELISISLNHRTQILYQADISLICVLLDLSPGKNVIEAGTGSGSLTASLSRSVLPGGNVFTFEYDKKRYLEAINDFKRYKLENIYCHHQDVCKDGFASPHIDLDSTLINAIFLDLPSPWLVVKHINSILTRGSKIVIFSPCIEQVSKNNFELINLKCSQIRTFEILYKPWGLVRGSLKDSSSDALRYQLPMRGHTGYITFAIKD
ncbi:hypothetical protein FG379_001443 [Cryptosporidium bovis]|uniref:uncharacterized protein n=1 Tax=Cryptosporidium bovis TaxID=310047 RepID=UPI00351A4278|nr:hypothetical protein FG379_001443 [Cryptosporidium bovis]